MFSAVSYTHLDVYKRQIEMWEDVGTRDEQIIIDVYKRQNPHKQKARRRKKCSNV